MEPPLKKAKVSEVETTLSDVFWAKDESKNRRFLGQEEDAVNDTSARIKAVFTKVSVTFLHILVLFFDISV